MSTALSTPQPDSSSTVGAPWNHSAASAYKSAALPERATSVAMVQDSQYPFPTVDVPDHAHYTIGSVILVIGITGMVGNFLVMYAFCKLHLQFVKLTNQRKETL
ncbi:hypothetical protein AOLI_G00134380 [Acnodon oligacanthus]